MKYITDLSEQEILALTQDELDRMVKLKMAEEGISLLKRPEEPVLKKLAEKDKKFYKVQGIDYMFTRVEDADVLSNALKECEVFLRDKGWSGVERPIETYTKAGTIESVEIYSQELWDSIQDDKKENDQLQKNYDETKTTFDKGFEESEYIREEVLGGYRAIVQKFKTLDGFIDIFIEYIELAEGNVQSAMKFLKKAQNINEEAEKYVEDNYQKAMKEKEEEKKQLEQIEKDFGETEEKQDQEEK